MNGSNDFGEEVAFQKQKDRLFFVLLVRDEETSVTYHLEGFMAVVLGRGQQVSREACYF
jgi:hypothetical protein